MKRYFLTHVLPEPLILPYRLSTAACNFSFNLMSGGGFDKVFSIMGTYVGGPMEEKAYQDKRFELVYNECLRSKGKLGRLMASFVEQWRIFCKIERGSSVWFYNVTTLNAVLYLLLRLIKRSVKVNVIELDFTPIEVGFGLNKWFLKIINNCHGNIRLAESYFFTNKNAATLPGVVPFNAGKEPLIEKPNNKFLLSGILNEVIAQTSMVLEVFTKLPHCELHITGKIDDDSKIKKYAAKFPNIIWHGQVPFQEYLAIMHLCTFQLSTRDENYPENQCNFPSKIIETLLHNRIIISTIAYNQLGELKYFKVNSELDCFVSHIDEISKMPEFQLIQYANQGAKVAEMFNTKVWNETMSKIEQA